MSKFNRHIWKRIRGGLRIFRKGSMYKFQSGINKPSLPYRKSISRNITKARERQILNEMSDQCQLRLKQKI